MESDSGDDGDCRLCNTIEQLMMKAHVFLLFLRKTYAFLCLQKLLI